MASFNRLNFFGSGAACIAILTGAAALRLAHGIDVPAAKHWAYQTPRAPALPQVTKPNWPRNGIDYFILRRLEKEGLAPSPEAGKETLLRRVTLDLTGLPPSIEEVDAFLADHSPEAYERVVDRLLASPRYGEQMAAVWLDEARFADSNGYQNDFHRSMWPWRDWVIQAFNRNMPYDEFVIEQVAGDLLPNPTKDQIIATGFNRNNRTVTEAGSIDEEWRVENTVDRVETTSQVFLGLTMGCARCHDHKFDPISQKEFYQFYAFFNNVNEQGVYTETRGNVPPLLSLPTPKQEREIQSLDAAIASAKKLAAEKERSLPEEQAKWEKTELGKELAPAPSDLLVRFSFDHSLEAEGGKIELKSQKAPVWVAAPFSQALQFEGKAASALDAGDAVRFERTNAFSYGTWVKPKGSGAVLSKMNEAANYRGFDLLLMPDQKLAVHLVHRWETNAIRVITKKSLPSSAWSHVMVSYDGSSKASGIKIFIDGKPAEFDATHDSLTGTIATEQPLRIGLRSENSPLDAALADVRFYGRALTQSEVRALIDRALRTVLEAQPGQRNADINKELAGYYRQQFAGDYVKAAAGLSAAEKKKKDFEKQIATVMVMEDRKTPRETFVLKRGQYDQPDKEKKVEPGVPAVLAPFPATAPRNRLGLAQWLVSPENPLTPRVAVSRFWERCFGVGLVKTSENFGVLGEPPSDRELLDWLATEFVRSGWNMKELQKLIVMSATYRQSSAVTRELFEKDPENRLLARGPRFRMPAEMVRDNALATAGLLVDEIGGPSVKPYQPGDLWSELAGGANEGPYRPDKGPGLYRRSLYIFRKRTVPPTTMSTFDAPSREICQVKRQRTNTPLQALELLNDTTYLEAARVLAEDALTKGGPDPAEKIRYTFRRATARWPRSEELTVLAKGFERYLSRFKSDPESAAHFIKHGDMPKHTNTPAPELAAYTAVASVILNLDETVTKE